MQVADLAFVGTSPTVDLICDVSSRLRIMHVQGQEINLEMPR